MSDEIKLPEGVAKAVVDAIEWMVDEGQWFNDPEQGAKLLEYLCMYHPKIYEESWCIKNAVSARGDNLPPTSDVMPPSQPAVNAENGDD